MNEDDGYCRSRDDLAEKLAGARERIAALLVKQMNALAAEREVSDKLEKALSKVQSEFYPYTEGFTTLWDEIDTALAEVAAIRAKQGEQ